MSRLCMLTTIRHLQLVFDDLRRLNTFNYKRITPDNSLNVFKPT